MNQIRMISYQSNISLKIKQVVLFMFQCFVYLGYEHMNLGSLYCLASNLVYFARDQYLSYKSGLKRKGHMKEE